ncbi:hypothetical protein [Longimicrobium sp.]|jgi:hypothetical protein|uniref:hypothetical protein n=1 Tax=Longimicrobium sp. TaxID=2029185 RepID=UPI002ED98881
MPARRRRWLLTVPVLAIGAAIWWLFLRESDDRSVLQVKLPASVQGVECVSWGFTDVLTKCAFRVDRHDYPRLLEGWSFTPFHCPPQNSQEAVGGPEVGQVFAVAECLSARPEEFTHGGRVFVVASADRTRGVVDLYIE